MTLSDQLSVNVKKSFYFIIDQIDVVRMFFIKSQKCVIEQEIRKREITKDQNKRKNCVYEHPSKSCNYFFIKAYSVNT